MKTIGNTVLLTGGTSGIGQAMAGWFHEQGNTVIICGRREERLREMEERYPGLVARVCDIGSAEERTEIVNWVMTHHPAVNVLVNNAGVQLVADLQQPVDMKRVYQEIDVNLVAPLHLASLFSSHLASKEDAAIVNISSGLAFSPLAFMPVYCATKAAVHSLSLSLRWQLRHTRVKVFEIIPPAVDTELGSDRRSDPNATHGGLPVEDFLREAVEALQQDILEAPVGMARHSREQREKMFETMNSRFPDLS